MPSDLTIAFLTDLHGNGFAADAIAREIRRATSDLIVNLGDQVWGQADTTRALCVQRELSALEVRGNNDERLVAPDGSLMGPQRELCDWLISLTPE